MKPDCRHAEWETRADLRGLPERPYLYSGGNCYLHNFYHADGKGNVTYLVNSSQGLAASYRYDPYGNLISQSGTLAFANVYRFSSKEIHWHSGFYYYGYRWYAPNLQRWLSRDPLGEPGFELLRRTAKHDPMGRIKQMIEAAASIDEGINLHRFVLNNPVNQVDSFGLVSLPPGWTGPGKPYNPTCNPFESPGPPNPCKAPDPSNCSKFVCMSCCTALGVNAFAYCGKIPHPAG